MSACMHSLIGYYRYIVYKALEINVLIKLIVLNQVPITDCFKLVKL